MGIITQVEMREEISPRTIYLPPLEEDEELFAKKIRCLEFRSNVFK
jgi:hypothetical protein|tara:strand:- start:504 stop:641 length:138 start_codon:yes stop_codon:yes gene_type:complete